VADGGERGQQQTQFADVGEAAVMMRVVEIGEVDQVGDDLVGGQFGDDVGPELLEIVHVAVHLGDGAVHALADLAIGETLQSEQVRLKHEGALGRVGIVGERHVTS